MIITLTKLRSQICLAQDLGRIFYQSCVRKDLESFSLVGVINVLATPRTSTRVRHVTTACALCARIREFQGKKDLSEKKLTRHFVDHRNVKMIAGAGGKGACTFHSEPRKEWGGPDGGNGGNGGNVIIKGRNVGGMDPESEKWANILWDYLQMHQPLEKSDVIIGLGCHDLRVAERSAALFLDGWAPCLLFTGYLGNQTAGVWTRPEAEVFLDVAVRMGVPRSQILLETEATNTGENICLSYRVLRDNHIPASRVILVQQPFMERRVLATFLRQWPEQGQQTHAVVTSPQMVLSEYPHPTVGTAANLISYMLGALERIRDYPHKGFQVEQAVTPCALSAYNWFLEAGYQPK